MRFCILTAFVAPLCCRAQTTTETLEQVNEQGEPLKPNERILPREQFDAGYWGIKLEDIQDERIIKKGDETLFITADGRLIIKKVVPGYAGETGISYPSTEQMLTEEKRWDELRDYYRKIDAKHPPPIDPASLRTRGRIDLAFFPATIRVGGATELRIGSEFIVSSTTYTISLSAAYDPAVIKWTGVNSRGVVVVTTQTVRLEHSHRAVLHLEYMCPPNADGRFQRGIMLSARGIARGSIQLEPLSVGNDPSRDRTYIALPRGAQKPEVSPVVLRVR